MLRRKQPHLFGNVLLVGLLAVIPACSSESGNGGTDTNGKDGSIKEDTGVDGTEMPDMHADSENGQPGRLEGYREQNTHITCPSNDSVSAEVTTNKAYQSLDFGSDFGCGVTEQGGVECWGREQLRRIADAPDRMAWDHVRISSGGNYACAIDQAGVVTCWGDQYAGDPSAEAPIDEEFYSVALGRQAACGLTQPDGEIKCWWSDRAISDGAAPPYSFTDVVPDGKFVRIAGATGQGDGSDVFCALRRSDSSGSNIECWGPRGGSATSPPDTKFVELGIGWNHTCGLTARNKVKCWSKGSNWQDGPDKSFEELESAIYNPCALDSNGEIQCWGRADTVTIFNNDRPATCMNSVVVGPPGACTPRSDGTWTCWGNETAKAFDFPE